MASKVSVKPSAAPMARTLGARRSPCGSLTPLPSTKVKPYRIVECPRHFECKVECTKDWAERRMIVGAVLAASVHSDCVDDRGFVIWDKVRSAHHCGAPYGGRSSPLMSRWQSTSGMRDQKWPSFLHVSARCSRNPDSVRSSASIAAGRYRPLS
jgi:hypothetical protein